MQSFMTFLNKYHSGDQIKHNEIGGAWGTYGREGRYYRLSVGKPEGKIPLVRPRLR